MIHKFLSILFILALVAGGLAALVRYYPAVGYIVSGFLGALILFSVGVFAYMLGRRLTASDYERAGNLVLRAQEINDKWDAAKTSALAQLVREAFRLRQDAVSTPDLPALPWEASAGEPMAWPPPPEKYEAAIDAESLDVDAEV